MKRYFLIFGQVAMAIVLFAACAERRYEELPPGEGQQTLDAWIENNVAAGLLPGLESMTVVNDLNPEGATMYYQWLERDASDDPDSVAMPKTSDWVRLDYTAYTLDGYQIQKVGGGIFEHKGNVYATRREDVARKVGSFNYYTHYDPIFFQYSDNGRLYDGQYEMLKRMRVGDSVRIFLPPSLVTNGGYIITSYGYGGNAIRSGLTPVVITMKMNSFDAEPMRSEMEAVAAFSNNFDPGWIERKVFEQDHLYAAYYEEDQKIEDIGEKDLIHVYYVGSFLKDGGRGFVFDTNIDSVATRLNRDASSLYPLYWPTSSEYTEAFETVLTQNEDATYDYKYGYKITVVTTSAKAYGDTGMAGSATQTYIQPYASLIFDIYIRKNKDAETDE